MKVKKVEEIVAFLSPIAESQGLEIIDAEFKISKNPSLTIYIDKEEGVDLIACENFHNAIDGPLDELDPTFGAAYTLNVSSPGIDRPFKTEKDFAKNLNCDVEVKLTSPYKKSKFYEGKMTDYNENWVEIETENGKIKFQRSQIEKISKAVKFN